MGRNLYILAAALGVFALLSLGLSFTRIGWQPGTPSDASLWRMTGLALMCCALVATLAGVMSSLFEQAERRDEEQRRERRKNRAGRP